MDYPTTFRTVKIDGLNIFYRESGARRMQRRFCRRTDFLRRVVADVRTAFHAAIQPLSSDRAGLSRLRAQRLA